MDNVHVFFSLSNCGSVLVYHLPLCVCLSVNFVMWFYLCAHCCEYIWFFHLFYFCRFLGTNVCLHTYALLCVCMLVCCMPVCLFACMLCCMLVCSVVCLSAYMLGCVFLCALVVVCFCVLLYVYFVACLVCLCVLLYAWYACVRVTFFPTIGDEQRLISTFHPQDCSATNQKSVSQQLL